jgi:type I restriction enzyme S subunit
MSSEWGVDQTISDFLKNHGGSIKTGPFGTTLKASEYTEIGVPLISVREIGHGNFHIDSKTPRVSKKVLDRLPEYVLEEGDIVFARKGGIERCALIKKAQSGWFLGSDGIRLRPPKACDPRFLAYALQTQMVKDWLVQNSTGSTMASLNQSTIGRLPIVMPNLRDQRSVADSLECLDDRIALLRETNATLEAIAQALFKSWFVDFDPVYAKQQGIAPAGMDDATAALFPDGFEESALGLVPKGWGIGSILEIASLLSGGTPKTDRPDYWGGDIQWASAKDVSQSAASVLIGTERTITQAGVDNSATRIIPALATVVVARGATTGRLVMLGTAMAMNQTCYALTSKHGVPVYLNLLFQRQVGSLLNAAHGSIFDTITTSTFSNSQCIQPPVELMSRFETIARALIDRVVNNVRSAQTLATLRDTLLPRLISGQLRLPEAEEALAEAIA